MLLSRITKYELELPHGKKVEFSMEQLVAFIIWLVEAYHGKVSPLVFNDFCILKTGEVIRIGERELAVDNIPNLVSEMNTLMPYFTFPSEMSIPERSLNSVRFLGESLGYFDANNESLLPVALRHDVKEEKFHVILGEKFTGKSNFSRYQFKDLSKGQI